MYIPLDSYGVLHATVVGWDYAEDHIWPDTDTLDIVGSGKILNLDILKTRNCSPKDG